MPFSSLRLQAVFDREFQIKGGIDAFFTERFAEFFTGRLAEVFTKRLVEFFTERLAEEEECWVLRL